MKEYFSHDYNAREDEKIKNLMFSHGWAGYGIYWALVEMLYLNDGYMQTHYERIAHDLRTDKSVIDSIINDFDLFKIKQNAFYSSSVLHRLKLRKGKSLSAKKAAEARWNKGKADDANAMQTHSESNAIKVKKSKEKESNINERFEKFIFIFNEILGKNYRGTEKAKSHFKQRIKENYTASQIIDAVKSAKADKYHKETRFKYLTPEYILRPDQLNKWANIINYDDAYKPSDYLK